MRTQICDRLGIEYPVVAFTPSEHVAAAVSRAGGLGVLGCVRFNDAGELDQVLDWMDSNTDGRPYGVDVVMPNRMPEEGNAADLSSHIPDEHRAFVERTLAELGVPELDSHPDGGAGVLGWLHSVARAHVDIALRHRISLIANALGSPPGDVIDAAHDAGVQVAALAGRASHARAHVDRGVDIVVAQGYEAGGHTGEIGSMVLLPEIVDEVGSEATVLAAGGIGSGRQIAAALALGADGVWMGSYWLTTTEYLITMSNSSTMQQALLAATSGDTVRTRIYSGKPARLLKTRWTEAWARPDAPSPLPMPLQNLLVGEAHARIAASRDPSVVAMPVGQIVGRMNAVRPVTEIMAELIAGFDEAADRLQATRVSPAR
ncbi:nitronate monooxygenase family protein [Tsukamurella sp. 8F]|uniref:NAD(P)H-dependent flavin oxidoreductase n=1 Tax=unclassified Tsukamurella TaxID=2633480 RepID=UPI0023B9CB5D|nr:MULTISPECIES: nitronate monooxygenase family protein [unclassified Tsukamurella]MDF0530729.1 nitronate monooxygenase family protein [Tsukamurella sp. 8J]MDF0587930.1 nitronate monooxygenase family protein [Tsukamurella sp. 8F]